MVVFLRAFLSEKDQVELGKLLLEKFQLQLTHKLSITLGSWSIADDDLEQLITSINPVVKKLHLFALRVRFACDLSHPLLAKFTFLPFKHSSIFALHNKIHELIAVPFYNYRKQDTPEHWLPHILIYECKKLDLQHMSEFFVTFRNVKRVTIDTIGITSVRPEKVIQTFPLL